MSNLKEVIRPVFRVFPEGDVVALWGRPDRRGMVSSYQHLGQHSDASADLMEDLRAASDDEKAPLVAELVRLGYEVATPLHMYSINTVDGDTLLCVECETWQEAVECIPGDMRSKYEFGECHLGIIETFGSYTVYELPRQLAEVAAHIRKVGVVTPQSKKVPSDEPRGCFQVFAGRKYGPHNRGYQDYYASFDSLASAKAYAIALYADDTYYTGYEWVQVADVLHGQVWDYIDGGWGTQHYDENGEDIEVHDFE